MKKIFSVVILFAILLIVSPNIYAAEIVNMNLSLGSIEIVGNADGTASYTQNGTTFQGSNMCLIRQSDITSATRNNITVSGVVDLTIANLNIAGYSPIWIEDNSTTNLNLVGKNRASGGIGMSKNTTFIINGPGELSVVGGSDMGICYPAIGNNYNRGNLIINSGTITAVGDQPYGSHYGVAIRAESILINGGTIMIAGDVEACREININDSNITIEDGDIMDDKCWVGADVIISNSTVLMKYGTIGGEYSGGCNSIKITNSNINFQNSDGNSEKYYERIYNPYVDASSHSALLNNNAIISTNASASSGLSYQWQVSNDNAVWSDIQNANQKILSIKMTNQNVGNYYRCKLTNGWGNVVYTDFSQLSLLSFSKQPENIDINIGDVVMFEASSNCKNITYQWEKSIDGGKTFTTVEGEIYNTLMLMGDLSENNILYRCIITADNGDSLASNTAKITVASPNVYYTEKIYTQNANNDDYTIVAQNVIVSAPGTSVTASKKEYTGFVENVSLGKHAGTVTSDNSLVLERYYDRNTYTITFNTNGGVVLPKLTSKYGADIVLPTPSRYGYSFEGWYIDNNLISKSDILTMPVDGATLYAKWTSLGDTSRGTEYKINALTLRNAADYEEIKSIPTSNFIAEVSVTNLSSEYTDTIIVATYDENGALIDLTYMYASIDIGETTSLGTLIKNTNGNASKVKVFVWPTLNSLTPLAESVEICK